MRAVREVLNVWGTARPVPATAQEIVDEGLFNSGAKNAYRSVVTTIYQQIRKDPEGTRTGVIQVPGTEDPIEIALLAWQV